MIWTMFRGVCIVFALLFARAAPAVECRDVAATGGNYTVCRVERNETLRVFHSNAKGVPYETFHALRDALKTQNLGLSFAMNAGMFHANKNAVGLLVAGGREITPVNRSDGTGNFFLRPNGVFYIDADGPRVVATEDFRNLSPREATQSGPMLVHRGLIPDTLQFRAASPSRRIRNGVCVPEPGVVAFAISATEVNFREFALLFRDGLHCDEALYLDGAISRVYAPAAGRSKDGGPFGPMIGVVVPLTPGT
jgi:uncharacterized protein YigE (DUF2233 family)